MATVYRIPLFPYDHVCQHGALTELALAYVLERDKSSDVISWSAFLYHAGVKRFGHDIFTNAIRLAEKEIVR